MMQVEQLIVYSEPLVTGTIGAASNMVHSKQQMVLLDQTKTVVECALQLLYVTKECGGNPKVIQILSCIFLNRLPHKMGIFYCDYYINYILY